jgi:DNA-binding response OmpR family regulator
MPVNEGSSKQRVDASRFPTVRVTMPPKVLLLDDDWSQRESLEETVADFEPDLVLVDILRSSFDGVEVVRRVKASGSTARVIIITRECSLETLKAVFPTGEVEYLIAPFPQQALAVAANRALTRGDLARRDQGPE